MKAILFQHFSLVLALLASGHIGSAQVATSIAPVEIGAMAGKQYSGDGLGIVATAEGAQLKCSFQKLNGQVTGEGLWLTSTANGAKGNPLRVVARALGREVMKPLSLTGKTEVPKGMARLIRPGLTEEYSVSVDGVRQDFIIRQRPEGSGLTKLELQVDGAMVEKLEDGVQLVTKESGRKLSYNRLKVTDAAGRSINAKIEVGKADTLTIVLEDEEAVYPVRIDPTFSDANWISFGGVPGIYGTVYSSAVDAAGNFYVGGEFAIAGNVSASNIAMWNGSSWSVVGKRNYRHKSK